MQKKTSEVRQAFKWTLYLRSISQVTTWLVSLIVIRFLTPEDYGLVALTEIVFMLVLQVSSAGLGDAVIQRSGNDEEFNRKILSILIILTASMSTLLFLAAPFIANYYQQPTLSLIFRISSLVFLVLPWLVISSSLLAKKMNFKSRGKVDLYAAVFCSLLSLLLAYSGFGFWSLIIASLTNIIIRAVGYNICLGKFYLPLFVFKDMAAPFKFGITVASTSFLFGVFMKLDVFIVSNTLDAKDLGYYALAMHLAILPMVKIMPLINEVAYPMYARIKSNTEECKSKLLYILRVTSFITFPAFFIFSSTSAEIVNLLLGEKWRPASVLLEIIVLTIPFRMLSNLFTPMLKALGHPQTGLQHVTFSCFVVAVAFIIAAPYGLTMIALAWLVVTPLILSFALTLCTKKSGVSLQNLLKTFTLPVVLSIATLLLIHLAHRYLTGNMPDIYSIAFKVILGTAIYLLLSIMFNKEQLKEVARFRL